jgi:hypothetical protein
MVSGRYSAMTVTYMYGHKHVFHCGQRCNYIDVIKRDTDCGEKGLRMIAGWREES